MSEEIMRKRYTRSEAEVATEAFLAYGSKGRYMLVELYEREVHIALGYSTFDEYAHDRLGVEWSPGYTRQVLMWGRIQREVLGIPNTETSKAINYSEMRQLSRIPQGQRKPAYEECMELCDKGKNYRPQSFLTNLTHIVNRRLKAIAPSPTEPPSTPAPSAPPSAPPPTEPPSAPPSAPPATTKRTKTYTPPPDPEPPEEPAWREWEECLNTVLTWVQNQSIDGDVRIRRQVKSALCDVMNWIDEAK